MEVLRLVFVGCWLLLLVMIGTKIIRELTTKSDEETMTMCFWMYVRSRPFRLKTLFTLFTDLSNSQRTARLSMPSHRVLVNLSVPEVLQFSPLVRLRACLSVLIGWCPEYSKFCEDLSEARRLN